MFVAAREETFEALSGSYKYSLILLGAFRAPRGKEER